MLVKHHGCYETIILSLDGSYHEMAKQSQENSRVKVFFDNNIVNIVNYLHGIEQSKVNPRRNYNKNNVVVLFT